MKFFMFMPCFVGLKEVRVEIAGDFEVKSQPEAKTKNKQKRKQCQQQGKEKRIPVPVAMQWGKNGQCQLICLFSL